MRLRSPVLLLFSDEYGCHGVEVFDKDVSSWLDNISEEHGLTEDGKTVALIVGSFGPKLRRPFEITLATVISRN